MALGAAGAFAQDAQAPLLSHSYEESDGGWMGIGGSGVVSVTHEAANVKNGKGALQFAYALTKGEFCLIVLPTPDKVLSKAKSLRFWVKADHATPLSLVVQEKNGGRYNAIFSVPKNGWQQVEVSTADFVLDRSKDAPKDPDGKLDMDLVENMGLADMAQMFVQGDGALAKAVGVSEGPRKLFMDDFAVTAASLPPACTLKGGEGSFDTFARPQLGWITVGDIVATRMTGKPLEGAGLQVKYHVGPGQVAGFARSVPADALTGAAKIKFSAASAKATKIVVQFDESSGGKYTTIIDLPGNSTRADYSLSVADFKPSDDSHDDNNRLDLDQVTQILFLDASGMLNQADLDNTIWINNIKAAK